MLSEIDLLPRTVGSFHILCQRDYSEYKVRYAVYLLEWLYSRPAEEFTVKIKPLREIPEREIGLYVVAKELEVHFDSCPYAMQSFRGEISEVINHLAEKHPTIKYSTLRGYDKIRGVLKEEFQKEYTISRCERCGEPSANRLCRACTFLKELVKTLQLENVEIVNARAEDYAKIKREQYDIVTARAVANLSTLSEFCIPFVKVGGCFVSYKSEKADEEMYKNKVLYYQNGKNDRRKNSAYSSA